MKHFAPLFAFLPLVCGCTLTSEAPMDLSSLPASSALETVGGYELSIDVDGALVARSPSGDLEAALGASLAEVDSGVVVTGRLDAASPLREGDRLLRALPVSAALVDDDRERFAHLADYEHKLDVLIEALVGWTPLERRQLRPHAVRDLASLRGYGLGWVVLYLELEREGQRRLVLREVGRPTPVAARPWEPQLTRKVGFSAVRVDSLPPHLRPKTSPMGGALITWVSPDSTFGIHGMRPLQVLAPVGEAVKEVGHNPYEAMVHSLEKMREDMRQEEEREEDDESTTLLLRDVDGSHVTIVMDRVTSQPRTEFELLWGALLRVRHDPTFTSVSIGPGGHVFGINSSLAYNPRTDRYVEGSSWSLAYDSMGGRSYGGDGRGGAGSFRVGLADGLPETVIDPQDDGPFFEGPFIFDWSQR
ncbi:MAG TPA: hypothetical protein DEA08_16605 [Planctomycetes bacterium]|nr:hypothetical protein [Planctomycetota bacterium]